MQRKKNILLLLVVIVGIFAGYTHAFSSQKVQCKNLNKAWKAYKEYFIQDDGRVIDYYAEHITTSEGQSYALMRSVWSNDKKEFDKVLKWTNNNLKIKDNNLLGWKWGKSKSGNWEIIDKTSASDADQDTAFALIMAYEKWKKKHYLEQAQSILKDMWNIEIIQINSKPYLIAGDWITTDNKIKINPSYLAPYAYRLFAKYDKTHNWKAVIDTSYEVIEKTSNLSLLNLPPDWAYIDKDTGEISVNTDINNSESDFSYDALRTYLRVAMDYIINKEARAIYYLKKSTPFLINYWQSTGDLPGAVNIYGVTKKAADSGAIYGAVLPAIGIINPEIASQIYHKKIASEYVKGFWGNPRDYYAQNIIWFGVAFWTTNNTQIEKEGICNLLAD